MTDLHAGFLGRIRAHPDEDGPRLVYADWLEEQGESDQAEFIRLQCLMAEIRQTCQCLACVQLRGDGLHHNGRCCLRQPDESGTSFWGQEQELFSFEHINRWFGPRVWLRTTVNPQEFQELCQQKLNSVLVRRGFIAEASLPLQDLLRTDSLVQQMVRCQPVQFVHVFDKAPLLFDKAPLPSKAVPESGGPKYAWYRDRGRQMQTRHHLLDAVFDKLILGRRETVPEGISHAGTVLRIYLDIPIAQQDLSQAVLKLLRGEHHADTS